MDDISNFFSNLRTAFGKAGTDAANALNGLATSADQGVKNVGNAVNQGVYNLTSSIKQQLAQPQAEKKTAAQTTSTGNASKSTAKSYARDPGIDAFVSILRQVFNPIRGVTGSTALDTVADVVSDSLYSSFGKAVDNESSQEQEQPAQVQPAQAQLSQAQPAQQAASATPQVSEDIVEYTYKPGDTFGQVIKNLGLNTDAGLWGKGGDVEYYTQQLVEQGALDNRGNVPIGTTIRLRKRKPGTATSAMTASPASTTSTGTTWTVGGPGTYMRAI